MSNDDKIKNPINEDGLSSERAAANQRQNKDNHQSKSRRPVTHYDLGELWDHVLSTGDVSVNCEIGVLGEHFQKINELTKWVTDANTTVVMYGDETLHIRNRHGEPSKDKRGRAIGEKRVGQLPIKKSDFENIRKVFEQPIFAVENDSKWGTALLISSKVAGDLVVIAIYAPAKNALRILSMRRYK